MFRLLCPISFSAVFSPLGTLRYPSVEHGRMEYISEDVLYSVSSGSNDTVNDFHQNEASGEEKSGVLKPVRNIVWTGAVIWVLGICVLGIYSVVTLIQLKRKLKTALWEKENIYITERIGTPFVIGILNPRIYLPSAIGTEEREYVLLHEKIHIKRGDHILKIAAFVALCIHWFNPLVWMAFFLSGKDMEMSCDEAVIRKIGSSVKKEYTTSLLCMATGRRIINGIPLAFGEGDTGSRIKNVLHYKKPTTFVVVAAIIVCFAAAVILLANPNSAEAGEKTDSFQAYYGVVEDVQIGDMVSRLLIVPGIGEVEIPGAEEIYTYFERDEQELLPGDMVQIVFPEGKEVLILETWPASFSVNAKSIIVMWQSCGLQCTNSGTYRFTFPEDIVPDVSMINPGI